jgi:hypothetical protein
VSLSVAALVIAAWGLLQRTSRARSGVLVAALAVGLAAAMLAWQFGAARPALAAEALGSPAKWAALHLVTGLVLVAMIVAVRAAPAVPTVAIVGLTAWIAWPLTSLPHPQRSLGAAAAWAAVGLLGGAAVFRLRPGRALVALDRLLDPRQHAEWRPAPNWVPTAWLLVVATGGVVALAIPHLVTTLGGSLLATLAGALGWRAAGRPAWGFLPALAALPLMLLWTLHLSGPLGGWIPTLIDGPFSPRAAQNLALLSLCAVIPLAGVWPLHGVTIPVLLAPVAIAVAGTFATLLIPDGVQWWQPVAAPLALAAMAHAVAQRRVAQLLVAGGLFGLWTGLPLGALGGGLLILSGWFAVTAPETWLGRLPIPFPVRQLAGLLPATGVLLVLHAGLRTEVAWSLAGAAIAAWGIVTSPGNHGAPVDRSGPPQHIPAVSSPADSRI